MAEWISEQEVFELAERAGHKIIELVNKEGDVWLGSPEHYPGGGGAVVVGSLHQDALDALSLNPQKIIDEFERVQGVAKALSTTDSARIIDAFRAIDYSVQDWQGDGATAFRTHVSRLQAFIGQQCSYTAETVKALGILLGIAIQVRDDYCALAAATINACDKALELNVEADTKFAIGVGTTLFSALVSVATGGALLTVSLSSFVAATGASAQMAVEGAKSPEIMSSYNGARRHLFESYKDNLASVQRIIADARSALAGEKNELFEPLPPTVNVNSPQFRYQDFYSLERDAGQFGSKVDQEKNSKLAGEGNPQGIIQRTLDD